MKILTEQIPLYEQLLSHSRKLESFILIVNYDDFYKSIVVINNGKLG